MARLHVIQSRIDNKMAAAMVAALENLGHRVSWDVNYLIPGEPWKKSLTDAVQFCDGLVALLTTNTINPQTGHISSQWMAADIGTARAIGKFVIPVILGDTMRIPALVDDLFAIIERDTRKINTVADAIHQATKKHMATIAKNWCFSLPAGYQHLSSAVAKFHEEYSYEESVFVMMKFPDITSLDVKKCKMLDDIWEVIETVVVRYGLQARRADKNQYYDQLWENVCVHMLGCRYGIAILEDRAATELNPNVTLEYGFMKAINASVALFRDINFKHDRADLTGKLARQFTIDRKGVLEKATLAKALKEWLKDLGLSPLATAKKTRT